jgi:hypothetical protein
MNRERVSNPELAQTLPINSSTFFSRVLEENRQLHQILALKRESLREEIREMRLRVKLLREQLIIPF